VPNDLEVEILKLLLKPPHGTDISIRQIAKKLHRPSSHIFYYLKRMTEKGILTKEESGGRGYYKPQAMFGREVEATQNMLLRICASARVCDNVESLDLVDEKLANCIVMFLKLHGLQCPRKV